MGNALQTWAWFFLFAYVGLMFFFGLLGRKRITGADDFATARAGYGPFVLALAFAATTASGATFLGIPGLAYTHGFSALWYAFLYPVGVYLGILLSQRAIARYGNRSAVRSIPEFLGERFQSEALRVGAALFSLILFFYLAAQLLAGLVMFEMMLGLSPPLALGITTLVLMGYVILGGAHADIMTDSVQAALMILLAIAITVMFFSGTGMDGGFSAVVDRLQTLDKNLTMPLHPESVLYDSGWALFAIVVAHIPLGLMPHIGNKLWALRDEQQRRRFLVYAFIMGMILPAMAFGGILARAVLGNALLDTGGANSAIPALFISIFPSWLAALLGVGILAAVMSTADGLVISMSQVFANDLYRRSVLPRLHSKLTAEEQDRYILTISRWATAMTLLISILLAWSFIGTNVALLVWIGVGGFTAALAGPLLIGSFWRRATRLAAITAFCSGAVTFIMLHGALLPFESLGQVGHWLAQKSPSPYSCSALGAMVSIAVLFIVSLMTEPMSEKHLQQVFSD